MTERSESMTLELRRGVLTLAVLSVLRQEHYGYSLRLLLREHGLDVEEGTLYPLIRRLESQGLLTSRWSADEGRKRRYYQISEAGSNTLSVLNREWQALNDSLQSIKRIGL